MRLNAYRLAATILVALVVLIPSHASTQDAPVNAPRAVMESIATSPAPTMTSAGLDGAGEVAMDSITARGALTGAS